MIRKTKLAPEKPCPSRPRKATVLPEARAAKAPGALRRTAEARPRGRPAIRQPGSEADLRRLQHALEVHQIELETQNAQLRQTQAELEAALERYAELYDFAPVAHLILKPDSTILLANLTAASLLGIERARLLKRRLIMFVAVGARPAFSALLTRVFQSKAPESGELRLSIKGEPPVSVQLQAHAAEDGRECRMVLLDITERKRAEEALRASEATARAHADELAVVLAATPAITFIAHDRECRHMTSSSAALRLLRLAVGANTSKTAPPGERPETFRAMSDGRELRPEELPVQRAAATGQAVHNAELTLAFNDGTARTILGNAVPLFDAEGKVRGAVGTFLDITESRRVAEVLRMTNAYNRSLIEASLDALVTVGPDGRITDVNRATETLTGRTRKELIGTDFSDYFTDPEKARTGYQQVFREGSVRNYPLELRHCDGHTTPVHYNASGYRDETGKVVGIFAAARDITERKQAEEALRHLPGRLLQVQDEERRRVARELHDTIAQSLAALSINLNLLQGAAPPLDERAKQLLADSVALAEHCTQQARTSSYLLYPPLLDELGLAGAIRDHADGFACRTGLRVDLELPPDLGRLPRETELALFRVLQEALANVHRHSGSKTASIRVAQPADEIRLEVRDKGHGMVPRSNPRAVGGYPTLGVGIAGMGERMRQLGGRLEIQSDDRGTTVIAILPRQQAMPRL
jgi:PAS domain S-box-containing protein